MAKRRRNDAETPSARARARARAGGPRTLGVAVAFALIALAVYAPAFDGPFFSDDQHYVERNDHIQELTLDNWIAVWSPTSIVVTLVENWAPVHLTLHGLAWQAFGADVFGHHVVNVSMHAAASTLLFLFFASCGIGRRTAFALAAVFLVHPANVEAVAWISQLKTTSALVLSLAALLLHPRRPLAAVVVFALALLAKPTAAVALPVAILLAVARREPLRAQGWLAVWALAFAGFAVVELYAFFDTAGQAESLYIGAAEQLRSHTAIVARYLLLAATGWKLSLFHEPPAAVSWLDPWWLGGLAVVVAIGWRCIVLLRTRSVELAFWAWLVVSWLPIGGLVALPYPMADRYLYFMLPGLLGGLAFALPALLERAGVSPAGWQRSGAAVAVALVVVALSGFAANRRAVLWSEPERLVAHAARAYPEGQTARLRSARQAAERGDVATTARLLSAAVARGFDRLDVLVSDPTYARLRGEPAYDAVVDALARRYVARIEARRRPSQVDLRVLAQSRYLLRDYAGAEAAYRRAIEAEGPYRDEIERELAAFQREWRRGGGP